MITTLVNLFLVISSDARYGRPSFVLPGLSSFIFSCILDGDERAPDYHEASLLKPHATLLPQCLVLPLLRGAVINAGRDSLANNNDSKAKSRSDNLRYLVHNFHRSRSKFIRLSSNNY
ncbi:hypothetical protein CVT26_012492 [Gymnopilus dilepis]|uniref:Uncharacterized protein n=1 Tax=Gymnopilus dilepis TaxID=231916 RepID=A0A409YCW5_9AGAR|nr:hypothetical protein CVT26_012492 [Gymnopilus dilepis]